MDPEPVTVTSRPLHNEREVVRSAGREAISTFLDSHNCFSVLRSSGKVVVFDTRIPIQLAFYALVEHDMQAAPLWDPALCQFVGLLTVTDFVDILLHYRANGLDVATLATRSIAEIVNDPALLASSPSSSSSSSSGLKRQFFHSADTSTSLKQACLMLHKNSMDFLPIMFPEDMRVLATITYTNILEHLVTHFREQRRLFDDTIYDLDIGTYHDRLVTVSPSQKLADALNLLHEHNLSALPIVTDDDERKIIGVYSRSDITFLATASDAEDAIANLDLTIEQIMAQQRKDMTTPDALQTCSKSHSLQSIFEYFAQLRFNRLFIVDEKDCVVGVVSAKDLVVYFLDV
mmetsp:Transcript_19141/g.21886  ORF Transcript_19141/g.21886 Transcript_19141/m.21886 type:complete len:346 (-) Transcript_19141:342-1379(-)|eukprot:CAMPEP_0194160012 /NCGR_PEP_ID=MMETSP0152-20130528/78152_1 /TAXON_ID=1049557 /ORGANISM="Thalassiothrix antarctica, Strain L6-D1" /LENGTH=345 /DNA_ID=CAMNT_0038869649 /DNA_START=402 /DNA_END=1439 /DNA_ORIENTATION=+